VVLWGDESPFVRQGIITVYICGGEQGYSLMNWDINPCEEQVKSDVIFQ
jgi:hypothetical protein